MTVNRRLIKEVFLSFAEKDIDPNDFVEWYCSHGFKINNFDKLNEASNDWLYSNIVLSESWKSAVAGGVLGGLFGGPLGIAAGAALGKNWRNWGAKAVQGAKNWVSSQSAEKEYEKIRNKKAAHPSSEKYKRQALLAQRAISNFLNRVDNSQTLRLKVQSAEFDKMLLNLKNQIETFSFIESKLHQIEKSPAEKLNESVLSLKIEKILLKKLGECKKLNLDVFQMLEDFLMNYHLQYENKIAFLETLDRESYENQNNIVSLSYVLDSLEKLQNELNPLMSFGINVKKDFKDYLNKAIDLAKKLDSDLRFGTNNFPIKPEKDDPDPPNLYIPRKNNPIIIRPVRTSFSPGDKIMINPAIFLFADSNQVVEKFIHYFQQSNVEEFDEEKKTFEQKNKKYFRFENPSGAFGLPLDYLAIASPENGRFIKSEVEAIINDEIAASKNPAIINKWNELKKVIFDKIDELVGAGSASGMP